MVRSQLSLLDHLGIEKLYASVGSSMGGMSTLSLAYMAPDRVERVASISATGRSGLGGVGMRYAQRSVLMADPNWNRGNYYDGVPPHSGMKLARRECPSISKPGRLLILRQRSQPSRIDLDQNGRNDSAEGCCLKRSRIRMATRVSPSWAQIFSSRRISTIK